MMDIYLKCELCVGYFGESGRWPRVLGCGHSICTLCTHLLLRESAIVCPKCSTPHPATSPNMVPLNHTVLKILGSPFLKELPNLDNPENQMKVLTALVSQQLSPGNSGSQEVCQGSEPSQLSSPTRSGPQVAAEPTHHAGICDEHGQYLLFWCNRCMEWICRDCVLVNHPHPVCSISSVRQALRDMQEKEDKLIKNTIKQFDENLRLFRLKHQLLRGVRDQHRKHVRELQHIISLHRQAERLLEREDADLQAAMSKGLRICFMLLESQGNLLEASSLREILASRLKAQEHQSAILSWFDQSLLKDSTDFMYSRTLQEATTAALAVLRQKMAFAGHSLTEESKQPRLPSNAKGSEKGTTEKAQDVEKLLFDSSGDSSVTGWLVLSPTVLHDQEKNEGADEVDDEDKLENQYKLKGTCQLQDQNPDEERKTGARKKQPERLLAKIKRSKEESTADVKYASSQELQNDSGENLETPSDVREDEDSSITVHHINREPILSDLQNTLQSIINKKEVSVEVQDVIQRSISVKQTHRLSCQKLPFNTSTQIKEVEEKERTILLVALRDQGDNANNSIKEKTASCEEFTVEESLLKDGESIQSGVKREESLEFLPGSENSNDIEMKSPASKQGEAENLERRQVTDRMMLPARDPLEPHEDSRRSETAQTDWSAKKDEEVAKDEICKNTLGETKKESSTDDQNKDLDNEGEDKLGKNRRSEESQNKSKENERKGNISKNKSEESHKDDNEGRGSPNKIESSEEDIQNKDAESVTFPEEGIEVTDDNSGETAEVVEASSLCSNEEEKSNEKLEKHDCIDSIVIADMKKGANTCKNQ